MHEANENEVPYKIYSSNPDLILNFDNEYMTFQMMEALNKFYDTGLADRPKKHYFNRFIKDLRQWNF